MILLAIDPGTKRKHSDGTARAGIALFDGDKLAACWLFASPDIAGLATAIGLQAPVDLVVVEVPKVYPRSPADPEDLILLAFTAGLLAGSARAADLKMVRPAAWKGQRPKDVDTALTLATLTDAERETFGRCTYDIPKGLRHNVIDAIGIGLWQLGRR